MKNRTIVYLDAVDEVCMVRPSSDKCAITSTIKQHPVVMVDYRC